MFDFDNLGWMISSIHLFSLLNMLLIGVGCGDLRSLSVNDAHGGSISLFWLSSTFLDKIMFLILISLLSVSSSFLQK